MRDGKEDKCSYAFREAPEVVECLRGAWAVLVGASNANIWTVILANLLARDAVLPVRDGFAIDGVFTQLIDVVIEDGKVVHKQVVLDPRATAGGQEAHNARAGAHEVERDQRVLREAFANVARAPKFSSQAVRITHFGSQFWDGADLALEAVQRDQGWAAAEVTVAVSIGLWYKNEWLCGPPRPCTRPSYTHMTAQELYAEYRRGLRKTLSAMEGFCSPGGRASRLGCAVTSLEHCPLMTIPFWHNLRDSMAVVMQNESRASPLLRFVDLWQLTSQIPEACLGGHQSPMSALLTWQVLLAGMCRSSTAAADSRIAFHGKTCRAWQVPGRCSPSALRAGGYKYPWDCAVSEPCVPEVRRRSQEPTHSSTTGSTTFTTLARTTTTTTTEAMLSAAGQSVADAAEHLVVAAGGASGQDGGTAPGRLFASPPGAAGASEADGGRWSARRCWPAFAAAVAAFLAAASLAGLLRGSSSRSGPLTPRSSIGGGGSDARREVEPMLAA